MADSEPEDDGYASANSARGSVGSQPYPPRREDYLFLGEEHCRTFMDVRIGSTNVPVVCPRRTESCGYPSHQRDRDAGNVASVGGYPRLVPPRSRRIYGARGEEPLTREEYDALGDVDGVNLEELARDLNPENPAPPGNADNHDSAREEEKVDETNPPEENPEPRASPRGATPPRGSVRTPANTTPPSALRGSRSAAGNQGPPPDPHWYGLVDSLSRRVIADSLTEMTALVHAGLQLRRVFDTRLEALNWKSAGEAIDVTDDPPGACEILLCTLSVDDNLQLLLMKKLKFSRITARLCQLTLR